MPIGLFVMLAVSFLVFRRARSAGRSSLLWVGILWLLTLAIGFLASMMGAFGTGLLSGNVTATAEDHANAVFGAMFGMFVGAGLTLWLCGRTPAVVKAKEEDVRNE